MARPSAVRERQPLSSRLPDVTADRPEMGFDPKPWALAGLAFAVLIAYLAVVTASAAVVFVVAYRAVVGATAPFLATGAIAVSGLVFAGSVVLGRGLFANAESPHDECLELTREDEPELFALLDELCERSEATLPDRVFARPDANAGIFVEFSLLDPFRPAEKHLLVGLGLVNLLNRTELEAVLAHEFGHFAQRSLWIHHHVQMAVGLLEELMRGCDQLEEAVRGWNRDAKPLVWALKLVRRPSDGLRERIRTLDASVSRRMELDADRVAVELTGSDALVSALERVQWADRCYAQTMYDLDRAAERGLGTEDLFFHHARLAETMPSEEAPPSRRRSSNGDPDSDLHPSEQTRRRQARARPHPTDFDDRSAWTLFEDPEVLREAITDVLYEQRWEDVDELSGTDQVQAFIDGEHEEVLLSQRDRAVYGHRYIEPGSLDEALEEIAEQPWSPARLSRQLQRLTGPKFREATRRVARNLESADPETGDPEADHRWLADWDRQMLVASLHAANHRGEEAASRLVQRYAFHLHLQDILRWLRAHTPLLAPICAAADAGKLDELPADDTSSTVCALYEGFRRGLCDGPVSPRLHGLSPGTPVSMLVLDASLPDRPPCTGGEFDEESLLRFADQWGRAVERLEHLRWKSLGALLLYQRELHSPHL